jgi:hypothetical protein
VAAGGSLRQLLALAAAVAVCAGYAGWRWRGRGACAGDRCVDPAPPPRSRWLRAAQAGLLALALAGVAAFLRHGDAVLLWWWIVGLLALAAAFFLLAEAPVYEPPIRGRSCEAALWMLAGACALIALVTHRPDVDDAFYVNMAVSAADAPDAPLLARDTIHGIPDLPLHHAVYRLHSYELWNGALSYLTGIPAIYAFHWISAALAAASVALAHAVLFRELTPRIWPWATAALIAVLVAAGDRHRWYGNFALVRIWQGKGIFLFVMMPLVYAYAQRFARRPSAAAWLLLAGAQIGAVGSSASALWAAPAGALAALASVLRPNRTGLRRFAAGALASAYVLLAGWLVKGSMYDYKPRRLDAEVGAELVQAVSEVMGKGRLCVFGLVAVAGAWGLWRRGPAQRFAIAVPLAALLALLNPYTELMVKGNVTGPSYWRSLWAVPVPLLMALVLASPLQLEASRASRAVGRLACIALTAAFVAWIPRIAAVSKQNDGVGMKMRIGWPGLKVPPEAYRWAAAINREAPPGATVIAPPAVSWWIPTFHHHVHPVEVRPEYLASHRERFPEGEMTDRHAVTRYTLGELTAPGASGRFRRALDRYDVKAVCLSIRSPLLTEAREILREGGFTRTLRGTDHELWVRP